METSPHIPLSSAVADLEALLDQLNQSDRQFADSLINGPYGFKKRGGLSQKQTPHVYRLLSKAMGIGDPTKVQIGGLETVYVMFEHAKQHIKWPKVMLKLADGTDVKIWVQGPNSKVPGAIGVVIGGQWAGRIQQNGDFDQGKEFSASQQKEEVIDLLKAFAHDPATIAAQYGKLSGNCSFCQTPLTDPKSLAVGYGPTCAKNYHLPWGSAKLTVMDISNGD